jgi:hypothetical protein
MACFVMRTSNYGLLTSIHQNHESVLSETIVGASRLAGCAMRCGDTREQRFAQRQ